MMGEFRELCKELEEPDNIVLIKTLYKKHTIANIPLMVIKKLHLLHRGFRTETYFLN